MERFLLYQSPRLLACPIDDDTYLINAATVSFIHSPDPNSRPVFSASLSVINRSRCIDYASLGHATVFVHIDIDTIDKCVPQFMSTYGRDSDGTVTRRIEKYQEFRIINYYEIITELVSHARDELEKLIL